MSVISVIIPVYNGERTIDKTIKSVLCQTFSDWELIIIDDGSQDLTLEIISRIKDHRLKVFSYPHTGSNASRNRGVSQACGEYISFLDADDLWTPDKLQSQLTVLLENPQAAVAYSWTNCIDESDNFLRQGSRANATGDVYARLLLTDFLDHGSNPLIRREAFDKVGGFDESLTHAEDWDMWLRLAAQYQFVVVSSPQILYRVSPNSSSSDIWKMETGCLQVIERAFSQAPKSLQALRKHSTANMYKYLIFKALDGDSGRERGVAATKFIWHVIKNDPSILLRGVLLKVLFKVGVLILLSPIHAQAFIAKFKKLLDTSTILGYLRINP
ncbi:glycosyltransferase [Limnofasciculus baicalensis]|uniref:Glycosyltransferase n=1 Tax=Limnofasciculus baicalensis BBK-W-15 TaxID=2699891 RepID=A0AAE3GTZ5_9CYAN|nr:glycosyltransferase [Limnofasciculus baicalensis]MCP2730017.1 glycosyltransferase [Limnofasciculus baicalensis BBK-W-15]